jgi:hypothetical protein
VGGVDRSLGDQIEQKKNVPSATTVSGSETPALDATPVLQQGVGAGLFGNGALGA